MDSAIVMIGPGGGKGGGGICAVIEAYKEEPVFAQLPIIHIRTREGPEGRAKLGVAVIAFVRFVYLLLRGKVRGVHVHTASRRSFLRKSFFLIAAYAARTPALIHIHGGGFAEFYRGGGRVRRWAIRSVLERATKIVVLSETWRRDIGRIVRRPALDVLPNPISLPPPRIAKADSARFTFAFLGRLEKEKGIFDLVQALAEARSQGADIVVRCGGAGDAQEVLSQARRRGVSGYIQLEGWLDRAGKADLLSRADGYVLPSYVEGLPMSVIEAMGYQLPVVATAVGGVPDLVEDGTTGFIVAPGHPMQLAEAMVGLARDRERSARFGRAARKKVAHCCVAHLVVRRLVQLYLDLDFLKAAEAPGLAPLMEDS